MEKTFELLVNLDLEELKNLNDPKKLNNLNTLKALKLFEQQLITDFEDHIETGTFDAIKLADNLLAQIRNLAVRGKAGINVESMDKLDQISIFHNSTDSMAAKVYQMYEAINTVKFEILNNTVKIDIASIESKNIESIESNTVKIDIASIENENIESIESNTVKIDNGSATNIKSIISDYYFHLEEKCNNEGLKLSSKEIAKEARTPKQQKLINRYNALTVLKNDLDTKKTLDTKDLDNVKSVYKTCLSNTPDWSERPFLQKLTDLLSLGLKPLYRAFFSKESQLGDQLDKQLKGPSPGGR